MNVSDNQDIQRMLGFDDVMIRPGEAGLDIRDVDISTSLTPNIALRFPLLAPPLPSISSVDMAIALSQAGSLGIIPQNEDLEQQIADVKQIKSVISGVVREVESVLPGLPVSEAKTMQEKYPKPAFIVADPNNQKVMGLVELSQLEQAQDHQVLADIMVDFSRISIRPGVKEQHIREIFIQYPDTPYLFVVDDQKRCHGVITKDEMMSKSDSTTATKDDRGALCVGAEIMPVKFNDFDKCLEHVWALIEAGTDVLFLEMLNANSKKIQDIITQIRRLQTDKKFDIVAGNVVDARGARCLIEAGADAIKVGIGARSTSRLNEMTGVGMPQISAIMEVYAECRHNHTPIIADGGIRQAGDIPKAIVAGADTVMIGGLIAGTEESAAKEIEHKGKRYKRYTNNTPYDIEHARKYAPVSASLTALISHLNSGLKLAMMQVKAVTLNDLQNKGEFIRLR